MKQSTNIYKLPVQKKPKQELKKSYLNEELRRLNHKKRIKIRIKNLKDRSFSLYLDLFQNGKREYQFLKLYLSGKKTNHQSDQETLKLALEIRDKKELELFQNDHDFELSNYKRKANFIEYFNTLKNSKPEPAKPWKNTYNYLKSFTDNRLTFNEIDKKWCERFKEYLLKHISPNTAHTYFSILKAALNQAIKDDIIKENPARFIHVKKEDVEREFLTHDEIKTLIDTPCENEQTKRAFLFTCFTGLRFHDVKSLKYEDVQKGYLRFRQKKTRGIERIKLSENSLEIIELQLKRAKRTEKVFDLFSHDYTLKQIKRWVEKSEINKKISWHSGRHTFATMALTYGVDLYTVSKLLGYKEIRSTQIYAKLIDRKKDEAIDMLPKI
jgi:site-specific recombinase XerD